MDTREARDHGARRRDGAAHRRAGVLVLAALIGLLAAGCGSEGDDAAADEPEPPATELTITVWPDGREGESVQTMLTCDPDGGTHPDPEAACAALSEDPEALEPVAPDVACTLIFGGPEQATVVGVLDGDEIDAAFEYSNGCEIDRWDRLAALLQLGD